MLTKFETKSSRVKGLAFHAKRPWILCSLHNGVIQLWDYRMETMIDKFEEHDGPVRGIDFHLTQPLFVSGGDDSKIRVWNFQMRRCLFALTGHLDYIRTVRFHHEYPWIISASDDQTIRIWNWQSRSCVSVLTGHNHYVMCASFHPSEDLVLSASLDLTVRVWDISGLRKKTVFSATASTGPKEFPDRRGHGSNPDMFASSDFVVKYVLEGHHRGVNWASFHPKLPLIVSGADDREVKLWRMSDVKAWEVDTMRGHINNVSCVIFHPRQELIISNSEDKSIRVWDMSRQSSPRAIRRENDRHWILASHPTLNILAAGHDSGMFMFKLELERPPFDVVKSLFYYNNRQVHMYNFANGTDVVIFSTKRQGSGSGKPSPQYLRYNSLNTSEHNILLLSDSDGGTYELYAVPKEGRPPTDEVQPQRGLCKSACFISRNRFAVLTLGSRLTLKNFENEAKRTIDLPVNTATAVYSAGLGRVLINCPDRFILFDTEAKKTLNEITIQTRCRVKFVSWTRDRKYCALVSKFVIYICDNNLNEVATLTENGRVKSGTWDEDNIFVYTTSNHIKYCLHTGDAGIIRTLDVPVYLTAVRGDTLFYLDRDCNTNVLKFDNTEAVFKRALIGRRYEEVMRIINSNKLIGQSILGYLQEKGFPEVALHFVKDERTRFMLALQCGNIDVALECAKQLNSPECWSGLAAIALRQGYREVVELSYQQTKQFEKLSFLYLITGDLVKLGKMLHISKVREDHMSRFQNALLLGDVEDRVALLTESGNHFLAYLTAKAHRLDDLAEEISANISEDARTYDTSKAKLLMPPSPIGLDLDWPKLVLKRGYFDQAAFDESTVDESAPATEQQPQISEMDVSGWGDEEPAAREDAGLAEDMGTAGGWGDDLLAALPVLAESTPVTATASATEDFFIMPNPGPGFMREWVESAESPCDYVAAGEFLLAKKMLGRLIGAVNFSPFIPHFKKIFSAAQMQIPSVSGSFASGLYREQRRPLIVVSLAKCSALMTEGYRLFMDTKRLNESELAFRSVLSMVPLISIENSSDVKEANNVVSSCKEYIIAARIAQSLQNENSDQRKCELAALVTICHLQPVHMFLCLYSAIGAAMKLQNFHLAGHFARRFLDLARSNRLPRMLEKAAENIKQVARHCDQNDNDANPIGFDPSQSYKVDAGTFTSIPFNSTSVIVCSYCASVYSSSSEGQVCLTCDVGQIGAPSQGLFHHISS